MRQPSMIIEMEGTASEPAKADAFRRLADSHLSDSYRLARLILRDSTEAEDAVHDAFVTAWTKWSSLRDRDRFTPWFDRIVVNTCRNRLRSRWRRQSHAEVTEASQVVTDPHAVTLDRDLVESAFGHLDPDDRIVLALRYYRDLQVDDISRLLDVRPGTVKSRLHRALGRLRAVMAVHGVVGTDG
jgi:RNA polymerase sigma-70 factor (ECF subfamily)